MRADGPAICSGSVWHRRNRPVVNEFTYRAAYAWFDPDRPQDLTARHPLFSSSRMAPGRFRRSDYWVDPDVQIGSAVRESVSSVLGRRPAGPIRVLTQLRRWGWLFNPITIYVVWDDDPDTPVAAVAEVTNTPWKERTIYPVRLAPAGEDRFTATMGKTLHVSPFLDEDFQYDLVVAEDDVLSVRIDVRRPGSDEPIVETQLDVTRTEPTRRALTRTLICDALTTRVVSAAIHAQAARLWAKRVAFVPHPSRRTSGPNNTEQSPEEVA